MITKPLISFNQRVVKVLKVLIICGRDVNSQCAAYTEHGVSNVIWGLSIKRSLQNADRSYLSASHSS